MPKEVKRKFRDFPSCYDGQGVRVCAINPSCSSFEDRGCDRRGLTKCPDTPRDQRPIEDRQSEIESLGIFGKRYVRTPTGNSLSDRPHLEYTGLEVKRGPRKKTYSVEKIVHGSVDEVQLRKLGLNPRTVDKWSTRVARGKIPEGMESMEDFERYVRKLLKGKR